jgi:L-2,4-diaminobutyric acid acetyltransferase
MTSQPDREEITLRKPTKADGQAIHDLIKNSPPLDLNSTYCYCLLGSHFAHTCVVAEQAGKVCGFFSAYIRPDAQDTLFAWQVVVDPSLRGQGIAGLMLSSLLSRPDCRGIRYLETTVGPSNAASRALFNRMAQSYAAAITETEFLAADAFGTPDHEAENLLRIGPLVTQQRTT